VTKYTVIIGGIPYKIEADERLVVGHVAYFRLNGKVIAEFNAERIDGIIVELEDA